MRSQKSIVRKAAKAKARRKDFAKKRNVRNNNWPSPRFEVNVPVMKATRNDKGTFDYKEVGERTETRQGGKKLLTPGDGILPRSRKFKEGRKAVKEKGELIINALAKTQATKK